MLMSCTNEISSKNLEVDDDIKYNESEKDIYEVNNEENIIVESSSPEIILDEPTELMDPIKTVRVLVNNLNIRESADLNSHVIHQVNMDSIFNVYEIVESNEYTWYKVLLDDNRTGWLASWFCKDLTSFLVNDSDEGYVHSIIDVAVLNVRELPTTESLIIGKTYLNERYVILDTVIDEDDKVWYKIHHEIGADGWIAGWFCNEGLYADKARFDSYDEIVGLPTDKNDFINLMLLDEFTLESILEYYGNDFLKDSNHYSEYYTYPNGVVIIEGYDGRIEIEVNNRKFRRVSTAKYDLFSDDGKEILVVYKVGITEYVLILNEKRDVLYSFVVRNVYLNKLLVGDFMNDGKNSIFIHTIGSEYEEKNIYTIEDDQLIKKYDLVDLNLFSDAIEVDLMDKTLYYKIHLYDEMTEGISQLPEKLFYSNSDTELDNLITFKKKWDIVEFDNKWYIRGIINCNLFLFDYLWGPPSAYLDPEYMYPFSTSLIQLETLLKIEEEVLTLANSELKVKYDEKISENTQILDFQDMRLIDGPWLDMSLVEAYEILGGQGTLENAKFTINGVTCYEEFGQVVSIQVTSSQYQNVNGIRVGLSVDEVEKILGQPDVGYSGDNFVEYKCFYGKDENYHMNYYRYLTIEYKNNIVISFSMNQIILD